MPERLIRPRRPIAWNALLRKGHVHSKSHTSARRASKSDVQDAIAEYQENQNEQTQMAPKGDLP